MKVPGSSPEAASERIHGLCVHLGEKKYYKQLLKLDESKVWTLAVLRAHNEETHKMDPLLSGAFLALSTSWLRCGVVSESVLSEPKFVLRNQTRCFFFFFTLKNSLKTDLMHVIKCRKVETIYLSCKGAQISWLAVCGSLTHHICLCRLRCAFIQNSDRGLEGLSSSEKKQRLKCNVNISPGVFNWHLYHTYLLRLCNNKYYFIAYVLFWLYLLNTPLWPIERHYKGDICKTSQDTSNCKHC